MEVKTYTDLKALIQALAGVSSFTTEEDTKILSFVNRRAAGTGVGGTNALVLSPAQGDVDRPRTRALPQRCSAPGTLDPTHGPERIDA